MPLTATSTPRRRIHTRQILYEGYKREDGAYEIEARIIDVKDQDYLLASGVRKGGDPVHDMSVRITYSPDFVITDVEACSDWVPYPGGCDTIGPAYKRLVGVSLLQGFRNALRERMGGIEGCTHITEMLGGLPTVAVQIRASEVVETEAVNGVRPFQLDRCHALATTTETVRHYYPEWHRDGKAAPPAPDRANTAGD